MQVTYEQKGQKPQISIASLLSMDGEIPAATLGYMVWLEKPSGDVQPTSFAYIEGGQGRHISWC